MNNKDEAIILFFLSASSHSDRRLKTRRRKYLRFDLGIFTAMHNRKRRNSRSKLLSNFKNLLLSVIFVCIFIGISFFSFLNPKIISEALHIVDLKYFINPNTNSNERQKENSNSECNSRSLQNVSDLDQICINNGSGIKRALNSSSIVSSSGNDLKGHLMSEDIQVEAVANSDSIYVSSLTELMDALSNSTGGETIYLTSGNYGDLGLFAARHEFVTFNSDVTLKSLDPDNPAIFESIDLRGVENLAFDSITFDYEAELGAPDHISPFRISDSKNITIKNSTFDGDLAEGVSETLDGYGTGHGLQVGASTGIVLENNEFFDFKRAAVFGYVDDLEITGNEIHDIRSDGLNFASVQNVVISDNYFHDFRGANGSGDHMDMIQFWTNGTDRPTVNVKISDNFLDSGEGSATQSIFMRNDMVDRGLAGQEMYYQDITIENNVIYNGHIHGITVGETDGLVIKNNTILQNPDSGSEEQVTIPSINVANDSLNVQIVNNIVPLLDFEAASHFHAENNILVQNKSPEQPNYVGDLFVNALAGDTAELIDLQVLPGSALSQAGAGSSLTVYGSQKEGVGYIANDAGTGLSILTHQFSTNLEDDIGLDLEGAKVSWDFGDGQKADGLNPAHTYSSAGTYDVEATITLPDGQSYIISKTIEVSSAVAIQANFDAGVSNAANGEINLISGEGLTFEASESGQAVRLNGSTISASKTPALLNNSEYTLFLDFRKDPGDEYATGRLVNFTDSFVVNVEEDGLAVAVTTDQGAFWLRTGDIGLNDSDWHTLALTFSGDSGSAILYVDGKEVARVENLEGAAQIGSPTQNLILGNPWGQEFPGLIDNFAFLKAAVPAKDVSKGVSIIEELTAVGTQNPADEEQPVNPDTPPPSDPLIDDEEEVTPGAPDVVPDVPEPDANIIDGSEGNDNLNGSDSADQINGNGGKDLIYAGDGDDIVYLGDKNWGRAEGEGGNDTIYGGIANDVLSGGDGNDLLYGENGSDKLFGGNGNDSLFGGEGVDKLYGEAGDDYIVSSNSDHNLLDGGDGNDELIGGSGRDYLQGGTGDDTLTGGGGKDQLIGGAGSDKFIFTADSGPGDTIADFNIEEDTIVLKGLSIDSVEQFFSRVSSVKGDLLINLDDPGTIFSWSNSDYIRLTDLSIEDFAQANIDILA